MSRSKGPSAYPARVLLLCALFACVRAKDGGPPDSGLPDAACTPDNPCPLKTCGNGVCDQGLFEGENCANCPADCPCATCSAGVCLDPGGTAYDETGTPVAGATVTFEGASSTTTTSADGRFGIHSAPDAGATLTLMFGSSAVDAGTRSSSFTAVHTSSDFTPLRKDTWIFRIASGPGPSPLRYEAYNLTISGGDALPSAATSTTAWISGYFHPTNTSQATIYGAVPTPWTVQAVQDGQAHPLRVIQVSDGGLWYGESSIDIVASQPVVGPVALAPYGSGVAAGQIDVPPGYVAESERALLYRYDDRNFYDEQLLLPWPGLDGGALPGQFAAPTLFVPPPAGGPASWFGLCIKLKSAISAAETETCHCFAQPASNVHLAAAAPPVLVSPVSGAGSFNPTRSPLVWQAPAGAAATDVQWVDLRTVAGPEDWRARIVLSAGATSTLLPDPAAVGTPLPRGATLSWQVSRFTPREGAGDALGVYSARDLCSGGVDLSVARSEAWTFTTPP